jgi:hypothetical protein
MKRERQATDNIITIHQQEFLVWGLSTFVKKPFPDEDSARQAWLDHRDYLMTLRDIPPRAGELHVSFMSGTRPHFWWLCERNQDPPRYEFRELRALGLIDAAEHRKAGELAVKQWTDFTAQFVQFWRRLAGKVTVDRLLDFWPVLPDVNKSGHLYDDDYGDGEDGAE